MAIIIEGISEYSYNDEDLLQFFLAAKTLNNNKEI